MAATVSSSGSPPASDGGGEEQGEYARAAALVGDVVYDAPPYAGHELEYLLYAVGQALLELMREMRARRGAGPAGADARRAAARA